MISLKLNEKQMKETIKRCREKNIILPTYAQMKDPNKVPASIKRELKDIGLWDVHSRNLFRITWKNEAQAKGGNFAGVNYMVLPSELTGVPAKIIALCGKWFPTGAHKVGATYGCLVPQLITGQFNPVSQKAVWPSTGNYCRGGAYVAALLACESIAILPEEMSKERFEWLAKVAGEVIATPGCESNVKEIFDKCWELRKTRKDIVIFNQFDEFGNHLWHYEVTGHAMQEVYEQEKLQGGKLSGVVLTSGSAGTTGCGSYLKTVYPNTKLAVAEALECPTLLQNGFGGHRIEGIGDKHVPWIHDVKDTDMIVAVEDEYTMRLLRLFNEVKGRQFLNKKGVEENFTKQLDLPGISSIGNMLSAIKFAKYYELTEKDVVMTVFTDSMELYQSRLKELSRDRGEYTEIQAAMDYELLQNIGTNNTLELSYQEKKRVHNLKYYTWIEQQARELEELNGQWYDHDAYWGKIRNMAPEIDNYIIEFNERVGLLK